jgi:hypothetical protein
MYTWARARERERSARAPGCCGRKRQLAPWHSAHPEREAVRARMQVLVRAWPVAAAARLSAQRVRSTQAAAPLGHGP